MTTGNEKSATSKNEQRDYLFEQVQVPRGCLGYIIADTETRLAAIVDPELEMVEPMIDLIFKHGLRVAYVIDSHTHADHVSGARDLKSKTIAKLVMHEEAPSGAVDIRIKDGDGYTWARCPSSSCTPLDTPRISSPSSCRAGYSPLTPSLSAPAVGRTSSTVAPSGSTTPSITLTRASPTSWRYGPATTYKGRNSSTLGDEKRNNPKVLFDSEEEFVEFMDLENPKRLDPVEHLAESLKANMK